MYQIKRGDTLSHLAVRFGTSVSALVKANPKITNPDLIYTGDSLNIPGKSDSFSPSSSRANSRANLRAGGTGGNASRPNAVDDSPAPSGTGGNAADIARRYLGRTANSLKLMNNDPVGRVMQDWVPGNVNCANFVSGVLATAGQISAGQGNASVYGLIGNLKNDPQWRSVPLSQARPGDVIAFKTGSQHVEIVAGNENGRLKLIGSNNINPDGTQSISNNYYGGNPIIAVMRYVG